MLNGDILPTDLPADTIDSMSINGPKPSAERCRVSETGDQLQNDVGSPLSATSPVSENGEDCFVSVSGNEHCIGSGVFDLSSVLYLTALWHICAT